MSLGLARRPEPFVGAQGVIEDKRRLGRTETQVALAPAAELLPRARHDVGGGLLPDARDAHVLQAESVAHLMRLGVLDGVVQSLPAEQDERPVRVAFLVILAPAW